MDLFSRHDLRALLGHQRTPCISCFMPTTRGTKQEDKLRWKNQVRQAEERLTAAGSRTSEVRDWLAPAHQLLEEVPFWQNVSNGLAAFLAPEMARFYRLATPFDEQVVIADHFQITPLLPLLSGDGRFFVLALGQKHVRLFQGTRSTMEEIDLAGVPASREEALQEDWVAETRNLHTHPAVAGPARSREAIFHGQGAGIDSPKEGLLEFCRRVDRGLQRFLRSDRSPLVVAAADVLLPIYRQANSYPHLLDEGIECPPEHWSAQELHDRAWEVVQPHFQEEREKTAALYQQLAGTGRTANDPATVVAAAAQGQIQTLFVALGRPQWGTFDPAQLKVEVHDAQGPRDEDLLNLAAIYTLAHKGTVYAVEPEQVPDATPLAAIFWLPIGERSSKKAI